MVAAGVGALLATSALAFNLIKWFGVVYLLYLAWRQLRAQPVSMEQDVSVRPLGQPLALVFRGFLVNVSNPKALVFMLAVLPQFLDLSHPLLSQYVLMAITMVTVDAVVMAGYTGLASKVLRLLRSPKQQKTMNRVFAGLFAGAAGLLTLVRRAAA